MKVARQEQQGGFPTLTRQAGDDMRESPQHKPRPSANSQPQMGGWSEPQDAREWLALDASKRHRRVKPMQVQFG